MFETKKAWDLIFLKLDHFSGFILRQVVILSSMFHIFIYVIFIFFLYKDICISQPWPMLLAHGSDPGPRPQALVLALNLYFSVLVLVSNSCFPAIQAFIGLL